MSFCPSAAHVAAYSIRAVQPLAACPLIMFAAQVACGKQQVANPQQAAMPRCQRVQRCATQSRNAKTFN